MRIRLRRRQLGKVFLLSSILTTLSKPFAKNVIASPKSIAYSQVDMIDVSLKINGTLHNLSLESRVTLLDALREYIGLTGTKKGCNHGACGACTVLVDDKRINACLTLAIMNTGKEITTIEGLATGEELHPLQAAFIKYDAFQCGYCTPGQICSAVACITENHATSECQIKEWMSGNLCRCGAYPNIVAAIHEVAQGKTNATI